jgi:hypothetical protein
MNLAHCKGMRKRTTIIALVPALALGLAIGCVGLRELHPERLTLLNPYEGVDWRTWGQYKANLHTHSTRSDGKLQPADVVRLYRSKGYQILALTDHETVTYPWTQYGVDPEALGMVAIRGAELYTEAHLNSYFSDVTRMRTAEASLIESGAKGGLIVFNHPASFTTNEPAFFIDLYRKYPHFIGLEAFNGGEQMSLGIPYWDVVLSELMPDRPVWGFANDDLHEAKQAGFNWDVFPLPALTEGGVRNAIEHGRFYICSVAEGASAPVFRSIAVSTNDGTITIQADNARTIRWIGNGDVVHEGACLNYRKLRPAVTYVRADITSPSGGRACTNPFGLRHGGAPKTPQPSDLCKKWEAKRAAIEKRLRAEMAENWKQSYREAARTRPQEWRELDLGPFVNRAMTGKDAWITKNYELTQLPLGRQTIQGVPFRILDQTEHNGRAVIALRSRSLPASQGQTLPDSVAVPVGGRVRALYVLHGAGFVSAHEHAGEYGFVYDDGSREKVDIVGLGAQTPSAREMDRRIGESNVQDWWPASVQFLNDHARKVMLVGRGNVEDVRYLYNLQIANPHPEKTVKEIRFQSQPDVKTTLLIVAATVATLP